MSALAPEPAVLQSDATKTARPTLLLLFGISIVAAACLLFLVEPLASKLILPWFGGSAAVWISCLLFFQAALLLGYLYAHLLSRFLQPRYQGYVHCCLLILSFVSLPILPNPSWQPGPGEDPTWRVLAALATSVGLPFTLLSATSPLFQSWCARTLQGPVPYRYFALSNTGSLAALLAYPVLVEPNLTTHQQAWAWSVAYVIVAALCVLAARVSRLGDIQTGAGQQVRKTRLSRSLVLVWLSLSACPSALLLAVTSLLTENVAPMPLLWVLPLSLYLLTFILCFERDRWYRRWLFLPFVPLALAALAAAAGPLNENSIITVVPLVSAAFFVCCMSCHGELARLKPDASGLTGFYLCLSAGGAGGGLFVALIAPRAFPAMFEYPITLLACAAVLLIATWRDRQRFQSRPFAKPAWLLSAAASLILAGYLTGQIWHAVARSTYLARNFYGALRVNDYTDPFHMHIRELKHGTITHGVQYRDLAFRNRPTTYYTYDSGIGLTWRILESGGPLKVGVVGLGTGTLAAYGRAGDVMRFYEINPLVAGVARRQFSFLSESPAHIEIVFGDARLRLQEEPDQHFDILVIDAFSGDAIPVHLLTREAFHMYFRHLKPDGVLVLHLSNLYLNLPPVAVLAARNAGKAFGEVENEDNERQQTYGSAYVLVTNRSGFFDNSVLKGHLEPVIVPNGLQQWTDDCNSLWRVLKLDGGE